MIDSHHHLWTLSQGAYDFPKPGDPVLYRDFELAELEAACHEAGVDRTVVVQTTAAVWETELLLKLASRSTLVAGVVGWCDLHSSDTGAVLDRFTRLGPLVGIRPMLQRYEDVSFLLADAVDRSLSEIARLRLVFDALVDARHLAILATVADRHPDLSIIIDHMAKPWRAPHSFEAWAVGMQALARHGNCSVKLSGFPFDATAGQPWHDYARLCAMLRDWFGPDRLLWGTDWPVLTRHASYDYAAKAIGLQFDATELELIGAGNARRLYRLAA